MIMDRFVNFTAGLVKTGAQISIIRAIHKKKAPKRPFSKSLSCNYGLGGCPAGAPCGDNGGVLIAS